MPRLLYAPASPYSAKIRMAAALCEIELELDAVKATDEPDALIAANPLGKIPTLVCDDGFACFDSRAIMQEIDRFGGKKLFPRNGLKRREAERLEAAADGLCDVLLAQVYEKRMRPEDKIHGPWLELQARKADRALDWLNDNCGRIGKKPHGGHLAVLAAIGYLELRFADMKWQKGRPKLKRFIAKATQELPALAALKPA